MIHVSNSAGGCAANRIRRTLACDAALPTPTGKPGDTGGFTALKGDLHNFISAVRSRKVSDLRADILQGHLSTAPVHMANASYRVGTSHSADEMRDAIQDRGREAVETFSRFQEHLAANGPLSNARFHLSLINGDGSGLRRLEFAGISDQMTYPSWYPDGKSIAVVDFSGDQRSAIKRIDIDTGTVVTLTDPETHWAEVPRMSPDGKSVRQLTPLERNAGHPT